MSLMLSPLADKGIKCDGVKMNCEGKEEKRKEKNNARIWYRHECQPVVQMLNTVDRVEA